MLIIENNSFSDMLHRDTRVIVTDPNDYRFRQSSIHSHVIIGYLNTPFLINGYTYMERTRVLTEQGHLNLHLEHVLHESETDKDIRYLRLFHETPEELHFNEDDYQEYMDGTIHNYYKVAFEKLEARNLVNYPIKFRIFKHKVKKVIVVVMNYYDTDQLTDYFLTTGLMPEYFEDFRETLHPTEKEYFETLVRRSQVKRIANNIVNNAYNEVVKLEKYRVFYKVNVLDIKLKNLAEARQNTVTSSIEQCRRRENSILADLATNLEEFERLNQILINLKSKESDVIENLKRGLENPHVVHYEIYNEHLQLFIKAPLNLYDPEEAELIINNVECGSARRVLKSIFIDQVYTLNVLAVFTFNTSSSNNFVAPRNMPAELGKNYDALYNPHYQYYSCIGTYKTDLLKAQTSLDLEIYVAQAITALRNINFRDGAVMGSFIQAFERHCGSDEWSEVLCLEDENGELISISDANKILERLEQDEEEDL